MALNTGSNVQPEGLLVKLQADGIKVQVNLDEDLAEVLERGCNSCNSDVSTTTCWQGN